MRRGLRTFLRSLVSLFIVLLPYKNSYSQAISPDEIIVNYSGRRQPLKKVIVALSKNTKVNISFSDDLIPVDSLVSFSFKKKSVNDILTELLFETNAEVKILDGDIVLVKRKIAENTKYRLYGFIEDFESGERLMNALIYFPDINKSTIANDFGYYSIELPRGKHKMRVQYLAYKELYKIFPMYKNREYNIQMNPLAMLNEVVIKNKFDQEVYSSNQGYEIPLEMTHSFISVGGEANIMKVIGASAGVSSAADQVSGISVRGGNASQNLVLMDGVPVYNADHAFGMFSIFNNDFLKSVKLYKGAFPSRYSGGLSSVIDVKTKEGNSKKAVGSISLGLFSIKGLLEGPIIKNKASYVVSARRTILDPMLERVLSALNNNNSSIQRNGNYYLYDINAKINYRINNKNQIFLSTYFGDDNFDITLNKISRDTSGIQFLAQDDFLFDYSNLLYSLRLNTTWNKSLFSNITAYSTGYKFSSFDSKYNELKNEVNSQWYDARLFRTDLRELGVKIDFDYMGINKHLFKFGSKVGYTIIKPGLIVDSKKSEGDLKVPTEESVEKRLNSYEQNNLNFTLYFEDEFQLYKNTYLNLGLNVNTYVFEERVATSLDPRLSALIKVGKYSFVGGFSMMTQFNHLLSNNGLGVPFNIWLPTTNQMKLEKGWIASLGGSYLYDESTKFTVDAYYKRMKNVYSFNEGKLLNINSKGNWDKRLPIGSVNAYGLELSSLKNIGKTIFDMNYTYSFAINNFDKINAGNSFYGSFDRRHMLNVSVTQRINKNAEFSGTWKIASGNHVTIGETPFLVFGGSTGDVPTIVLNVDEINNHQLPVFHRLDLGFNVYSDFSWGRQKISLGIVNAYNRKNPYYLDVEILGIESVSYKQYSLISILPSITYSISFK